MRCGVISRLLRSMGHVYWRRGVKLGESSGRQFFAIAAWLVVGYSGMGCWVYASDHCGNRGGNLACSQPGSFCDLCQVENDGCASVVPSPGCRYPAGGTGLGSSGGLGSASDDADTMMKNPVRLTADTTASNSNSSSVPGTSGSGAATANESETITTGLGMTSGTETTATGTTGCEAGGHPHEGRYEGMWSGDCPGFLFGDISFVVCGTGALDGALTGDLQGEVSGSVNNGGTIGNGVLTWDFEIDCVFDGQIDAMGSVTNGTWSCPRMKPCSGTWMASIL